MNDHVDETKAIQQGINTLYKLIEIELSKDWKDYIVTINDEVFEINSECTQSVKSMVIKELLRDAITSYIDGIQKENYMDPFNVINQLFNGARKEDHQFELVKEEIVSNLDKDGIPISAKSLNHDSVFVQWQDENKFKFEEEE